MKLIVSILLLTAFTAGSYSQSDSDWVLAAKGRDDASYYYNARRFTRISPDIVETWIKIVDPQGSLKAQDVATTRVTREQFNCVSLSERPLSAIYYNIAGKVLRVSDFESDGNDKWVSVVPESVGEQVLSVVCQHQKDLDKVYDDIISAPKSKTDISDGYLRDGQDIPTPKPKPKPKRKRTRKP